jgi:hypothetical protein
MSRSRSRLAADWFAKLRQNLNTGLVEHEEVAAVQSEVSTNVNTQLASIESQITAVQTEVSNTVNTQITSIENQLANMSGLTTDSWSVKEVDQSLMFSFNNSTKAILEPNGKFTIDNDLVTFGISIYTLIIESNLTNVNLRDYAIANGWDQTSQLIVTINSGVYVSSNNTGIPALTVAGSFPGGIHIINNGFVCGMGGAGGSHNAGGGGAGGTALYTSALMQLTNNGTIAGGGGGGGAGRYVPNAVGGGGGGGRSGHVNSGGGYINGGAGTSAGAGGGGGGSGRYYDGYNYFYPAGGGSGGNWGAGAGGGGGTNWGGGGGGGAGGRCVDGNSLITWKYIGSRYGALV